MATNENKTSSQPNLRDASSTTASASSTDSIRDTANRFAEEASPRVREAFDQFSDVASDLYGRANQWLSQGNNRNYGMIALVATAGILGFVLGRNLGSREEF